MLSGTGRGLFMVTSPAVALGIAPHLALVTLPTALIVIGAAMAAMPASLFMRRFGRKSGFMCGTAIAALSGLSCTAAVVYENFYLLALGGFCMGCLPVLLSFTALRSLMSHLSSFAARPYRLF